MQKYSKYKPTDIDKIYYDAVKIVKHSRKATHAVLRNNLNISQTIAIKLLDKMEYNGIVKTLPNNRRVVL